MFYFLSKTLTFLFMPVGLLTIALLFAVLSKNRGRQRKALFFALTLLFVAGNGFITNELLVWWEGSPVVLPARTQPRVGVVLTGGLTNVDNRLRPYIHLGNQGDRLVQALLLYKSGQIQKILISGGIGGIIKRDAGDEGQLSRDFLRIAGVPAQDILLENNSRNTYENARFSAPILKKSFTGYEYVLITSAWHMRRAVGCFRKQQLAVTPYPATFVSQQREYSPNHLLFPSEQSLFDCYWFIHEVVGYVAYQVAGYI